MAVGLLPVAAIIAVATASVSGDVPDVSIYFECESVIESYGQAPPSDIELDDEWSSGWLQTSTDQVALVYRSQSRRSGQRSSAILALDGFIFWGYQSGASGAWQWSASFGSPADAWRAVCDRVVVGVWHFGFFPFNNGNSISEIVNTHTDNVDSATAKGIPYIADTVFGAAIIIPGEMGASLVEAWIKAGFNQHNEQSGRATYYDQGPLAYCSSPQPRLNDFERSGIVGAPYTTGVLAVEERHERGSVAAWKHIIRHYVQPVRSLAGFIEASSVPWPSKVAHRDVPGLSYVLTESGLEAELPIWLPHIVASVRTNGTPNQSPSSLDSGTTDSAPTGPFCGLTCIAAAEVLDGKPPRLAELARDFPPQCFEGHSLGELEEIAIHCGFQPQILHRLSHFELELLGRLSPLLLYVRSYPTDEMPNHMILFWKEQDGARRFLDPASKDASSADIVWSRLLQVWDGTAIALRGNDMPSSTLFGYRFTASAIPVGCAALVVLGAVVIRRISKSGRWTAVYIVLGLAAAVALSYPVLGVGMPWSPSVWSVLSERWNPTWQDWVSVDAVNQNDDALLIDARGRRSDTGPRDREVIAIGPAATSSEMVRLLERVDRGRPITVFCEPGCTRSMSVAARLRALGFFRVSTLDGDWRQLKIGRGPDAPAAEF